MLVNTAVNTAVAFVDAFVDVDAVASVDVNLYYEIYIYILVI